jgi:hypothetical protein
VDILRASVSERMPQRRAPATLRDGTMPDSRNFRARIVEVAPTGSFKNFTGFRVVIGLKRWW